MSVRAALKEKDNLTSRLRKSEEIKIEWKFQACISPSTKKFYSPQNRIAKYRYSENGVWRGIDGEKVWFADFESLDFSGLFEFRNRL